MKNKSKMGNKQNVRSSSEYKYDIELDKELSFENIEIEDGYKDELILVDFNGVKNDIDFLHLNFTDSLNEVEFINNISFKESGKDIYNEISLEISEIINDIIDKLIDKKNKEMEKDIYNEISLEIGGIINDIIDKLIDKGNENSEYKLECNAIRFNGYMENVNSLKKVIVIMGNNIYLKIKSIYGTFDFRLLNRNEIRMEYDHYSEILNKFSNLNNELLISTIIRFEERYIKDIKFKIGEYDFNNWIILEKTISLIIDNMIEDLLKTLLDDYLSKVYLKTFPDNIFNLKKEVCNIFNIGIDENNRFGLNKYYLK